MSSLRCAALIYGPELHHLDHLAPLCAVMQMPLLVTEENIAASAKNYYPHLHVQLHNYLTIAENLVSHFDVVFYSIPRDLFDEIFFFAQKLLKKKVHTIWCPHGNSDKGNQIFYMEALHKEEIALVYGKQMIEFLKRKNVYDQLKAHVITGNYRYKFYLAHRDFFDGIAKREVFDRLNPGLKNLLYAPTWRDYENSSSFFDAISFLIEDLPAHYNLIVKLHPNLIAQEEFLVEDILEKYSAYDRVLFLTDFPLIYPLLNGVDVYIGDMSSIGYDFLVFDRPLFFLNQNKRDQEDDLGRYLFRCGIEIAPDEYGKIYSKIAHFFQYDLRNFSELRREVCHLAFAESKTLESLHTEIQASLKVFPDPELNFYHP